MVGRGGEGRGARHGLRPLETSSGSAPDFRVFNAPLRGFSLKFGYGGGVQKTKMMVPTGRSKI